MFLLKSFFVGVSVIAVLALIIVGYIRLEEKFGAFFIWLVTFGVVLTTILGSCVIQLLGL